MTEQDWLQATKPQPNAEVPQGQGQRQEAKILAMALSGIRLEIWRRN